MISPRLLCVVLLVAAGTTAALPAQGRRGGRRRMPTPPVLLALDLDGDGDLSNEELDRAAKSLLALDKNGDGNLSLAELAPAVPERTARPPGGRGEGPQGGPGRPGGGMFASMMASMMANHPVMLALDKDGDGELFEDEVREAARSLDRLDVDDDDIVAAGEMRPRRTGFGRGRRGGSQQGGGYDTVPKPSELRREDGVANIPDLATFGELSYQGEEVMVDTHLADLEFVKFQIEAADSEQPLLYFMNTNKFRGHPMFMQAIGVGGRGGFGGGRGSEDGGSMRMRGVLVFRPTLMSPAGNVGLYTFEFEPNDSYSYPMIRIAYEQLVAHASILRGNLSFNLLPRAKQQWQKEKADYARGNLPVFFADDVYGDVGFLPLNKAESYGRLRLMEPGERPSPRDIVLYRSLPNEMPRVAGVLTGFRQTPLSHVNLRAVQDRVPNAFVMGAVDNPSIKKLIGRYVYYKVDDRGYELREATGEQVELHFAAMRPSAAQVPVRDLSVKEIRPFAEIGFGDAKNVGVKAANLAVMRRFGWPAERSPNGYAIPFAFYDAFMTHNGFYEDARAMMARPEFQRDANTRVRSLKKFRKAIKAAKMPSWMVAALTSVQGRFGKGESIRCRSSTNNEDLPGFSGAGLYDSFTHKPSEGHLGKSIRQVFASMWNDRAFVEREFHRIDHLVAAMGVVLHVNTVDEQVNGVAVTKDVLYQGRHRNMHLYYVNSQVGEDLVTNPDAESVPEEMLLSPRNPRTDRVLQYSNRRSTATALLPGDTRQELRRCMRILQKRFARLYDREEDGGFAMEIEFKLTSTGKLLIKQARPWIE